MKKLFFAALLAAVATPAAAQAPLPDADPAMWVVKDQDTTIYMLGTFHMLDGKQDWFNDEVKAAFDASQEVVLEAVMPEDQAALAPLVMKYATDPSGKTLSSKLTPAVKAKLDKQLASIGAPGAAFDKFDPWFASMSFTQIAAQKLGLTGEHGPEMVITKAAKAKNIPVGELEGFEWQLAMFDKMPEAQQVAFLGQSLDGMDKIAETLVPMKDAWAKGDTAALVKLLNEGLKDDPALYELLLTKRNATWAEWIDNRLDKPGTVFMAVGAGHLAGKDSIQELLAKRGIRSQLVKK